MVDTAKVEAEPGSTDATWSWCWRRTSGPRQAGGLRGHLEAPADDTDHGDGSGDRRPPGPARYGRSTRPVPVADATNDRIDRGRRAAPGRAEVITNPKPRTQKE